MRIDLKYPAAKLGDVNIDDNYLIICPCPPDKVEMLCLTNVKDHGERGRATKTINKDEKDEIVEVFRSAGYNISDRTIPAAQRKRDKEVF